MRFSSRLFFALAAVLILAWGLVEAFLRLHLSDKSPPLCEALPLQEINLKDQMLVASDAFRALIVNPRTGVLSEFKWDSQSPKDIAQLICTHPSPHCLIREIETGRKEPSSEAHLNWMRHLAGEVGLLSWNSDSKHTQILPFLLTPEKQLRLSNPLQFCEAGSPLEKRQFSLFGSRLVSWSPEGSYFEIFDLSPFEGSSPRAIARRADQIWQIEGLHPIQTSCPDLKTQKNFPQPPLALSSETGLFMRDSNLAEGLNQIHLTFVPALGSSLVTEVPPPLRAENQWPSSSPFIIRRDEWISPDIALRMSSRRVLSSLQIDLYSTGNRSSETLISSLWWRLWRGTIDHSSAQKTGDKLWVIEQQGSDLQLGQWRCSSDQFVKTSPRSPVIPW